MLGLPTPYLFLGLCPPSLKRADLRLCCSTWKSGVQFFPFPILKIVAQFFPYCVLPDKKSPRREVVRSSAGAGVIYPPFLGSFA